MPREASGRSRQRHPPVVRRPFGPKGQQQFLDRFQDRSRSSHPAENAARCRPDEVPRSTPPCPRGPRPSPSSTRPVYDPLIDDAVEREFRQAGRELRTFSLAVNTTYEAGNPVTRRHRCVDWQDHTATYRKGDRVSLSGFFKTRTYAKDGETKSSSSPTPKLERMKPRPDRLTISQPTRALPPGRVSPALDDPPSCPREVRCMRWPRAGGSWTCFGRVACRFAGMLKYKPKPRSSIPRMKVTSVTVGRGGSSAGATTSQEYEDARPWNAPPGNLTAGSSNRPPESLEP
jgi:hypothetical protein